MFTIPPRPPSYTKASNEQIHPGINQTQNASNFNNSAIPLPYQPAPLMINQPYKNSSIYNQGNSPPKMNFNTFAQGNQMSNPLFTVPPHPLPNSQPSMASQPQQTQASVNTPPSLLSNLNQSQVGVSSNAPTSIIERQQETIFGPRTFNAPNSLNQQSNTAPNIFSHSPSRRSINSNDNMQDTFTSFNSRPSNTSSFY
jgi:hypothetical protein